jgi:catechol 2,3-dioxygenase-like lactoylglutathione lyase family enzyme
MMKLDAVAVSSRNLRETTSFYSLLGFRFPEFDDAEKHVEAITAEGGVRLMIDDKDLIESILGEAPVPANHSMFAILCDSPAEMDLVVEKIRAAGHPVIKEPWDAFWGQRYAVVADPDGYRIDLFASLAPTAAASASTTATSSAAIATASSTIAASVAAGPA